MGKHRSKVASVLIAMISNMLEWYDFAIFGQLAIDLGRLFFPETSRTAAMIGVFAIFAIGFVMRPFGGALFGYIGDRFGRKKAVVIAIFMMIIPTGCIGLLPTYATIGIAAPIILTTLRMLQGLALGGSYSGAITYTIEHGNPKRRGFMSIFSTGSLILGFMLGSAVAVICLLFIPEAQFDVWGWRLPFFLGTVIGIIGLFLRSSSFESPIFQKTEEEKKSEEETYSPNPIIHVLKCHWQKILQMILIYILLTVPFYIISIYWISFSEGALHMTHQQTFWLNFLNLSFMLVGAFIGGVLSDYLGRKPVLIGGALLIAGVSYPIFSHIEHESLFVIYLVQNSMAFIAGLYIGPLPALFVEAFPSHVRLTGISIAYNVSAATFGGTAPMVAVWLYHLTGSETSLAYYLMACCVVALLALLPLKDHWRAELK